MKALLRAPYLWVAIVLVALSFVWIAADAPISLITQIAIYALYGAGVNLLVGYTGLVPFGASVFFGSASYAAAFVALGHYGNDLVSLVLATLFATVTPTSNLSPGAASVGAAGVITNGPRISESCCTAPTASGATDTAMIFSVPLK